MPGSGAVAGYVAARTGAVDGYLVGHTCLKRGCDKPTWNGRPNEYCCKAHKDMGSETVVADVVWACLAGTFSQPLAVARPSSSCFEGLQK